MNGRNLWLAQLVQMQKKEALILPADPKKGRPINVKNHIIEDEPLEVSAFQIDSQSPVRFNIHNQDGTHPVLIHANIVGSIERFMYAVINTSAKYPTWLAPEQVRIIPHTFQDIGRAVEIAGQMNANDIRVTVDKLK